MSDHDAPINGHLLRLQRETRGWTMTDMAMRSCLSTKQIRQLEEGGSESFYSDAVKLTAAKKVASLLGLSLEQVLGQPAHAVSLSAETFSPSVTLTDAAESEAKVQKQETPVDPVISPMALSQAPSSQSELGHAESLPVDVQQTSDLNPSAKSSQTSVWVMAVLFAVALLVAAWMNPSAEPAAAEAAPPLQTLPADMSEPASSAAVVASDASASSAPVASQARATGAQVAAASAAASSPAMRASEATEAASR